MLQVLVGTIIIGSVPGIDVSDSVLGVTGVTRALSEGMETGGSPGAEVSPLGGADAGAVAVMSTALLANQLPPLSKFDGNVLDGDKETIEEWLSWWQKCVSGMAPLSLLT